ncbi:MAG: hypothetical protein Q9220_000134 [cf. Caloplaca sp. 1 TL-2023]
MPSEPYRSQFADNFAGPELTGSKHRQSHVQQSSSIPSKLRPSNKSSPYGPKQNQPQFRSRASWTSINGNHQVLPHTKAAGDPYYIGDVYQQSRIRQSLPLSEKSRQDDAESSMPYLDYIDRLTDNGWPHLRYLADFMRVSTAPVQWRFLTKDDVDERANRVNIALLEFFDSYHVRHDITTVGELEHALQDSSSRPDHLLARLFIVEDLSREVIERMGFHLHVDPMFFRGHISDFNWYNTRDPWIEFPSMDIVAQQQSYFSARYAQARYFRTHKSVSRARSEAGGFNVLRRVDRDGNWIGGIDIEGSDVALVRSRMSFWSQPRVSSDSQPTVGIILVDPSITEGFPLWGGYNNFTPCPSMVDIIPSQPRRNSTFEDTVHWLQQISADDVQKISHDPRALFLQPLCIVCSEWLVLVRYGNTRLSQLEWEIEDPDLRSRQEDLSETLSRLHAWRRRFPIYKDIISETLSQAIRRENLLHASKNSLLALEKDFEIIYAELNKLHERSERIMSVVTAVMSIEESQKALQQDRSLARLTWLATTFVPLSFVSSFFSMSDDVTALHKTFWIYFTVAIPITLLALVATRYSGTVFGCGDRIMQRRKRNRHHDQ